MHIAVIGGGLMGMALAYFLTEKGQTVTVLEQNADIGGLHSTFALDDDLCVTRYQHHILPHDHHIQRLITRIGLQEQLVSYPANTGLVHHGAIYPLRTLWDFLSFNPLGVWDRVRLGQTILQARLLADWRALDNVPVKEWLVNTGGRQNFDHIWAPLLEAKFDHEYDYIPATFIWSWLNRMSAVRRGPYLRGNINYLRYGPVSLINALAQAITARGGTIQTQVRVREIEVAQGQVGRVRTHTGIMQFDAVIGAIPTPEFGRLLLSADERYLNTLGETQYLGLVCPLLVLDRPLSSYWTLNLTDPSSPFSSIVEWPYANDPRYHIAYLPKYTAPENDWMGVPDATIQDAWLLRLRQIFPSLKTSNIQHFVVSRSRYVDPVHKLNAAARIPAVQTPYDGLFLANTGQVYPDLPNSDAVVAHAQRVAQLVIEQVRMQRNQRIVAA
jgi:protoporphyrinogen oxidase